MQHRRKSKKQSKTLLVNLSLATMLGLFPSTADAQSILCPEPMVFGEIITCGAAGTVTVRPDNSTTSSCVTIGAAPQSRARCLVTQPPPGFRPIQISITTPTTTINNGGGASMSVNAFNIVTNAGGVATTITAPFVNVPIGATLSVGASQAGGNYSGSFSITAVLQ